MKGNTYEHLSLEHAPSETIHKYKQDDPYLRITKRELLQVHRAQPILSENLLLATEIGSYTDVATAPSMECIFQILQFTKKLKWLCFWGPERVDETLRPPSASLPMNIFKKSLTYLWTQAKPLPHGKLRKFLSDPSHRWDRIMLDHYDPEYFEFLSLHPCQELWLYFKERVELTIKDMQNIGKCGNLRNLSMEGYCEVSAEAISALSHLPNLQKVVHFQACTYPCIRALMELPHINMMLINPPSINDNEFHPLFFPFMREQMETVDEYIRNQREYARELRIMVSISGAFILRSLGQFSQVESISIIEMMFAFKENILHDLLKHEKLHHSVRHIYLARTRIEPKLASCLAMFRNLAWLELECLTASSDKIAPVILANARNLLSLSIFSCKSVGDELLEAIAQCQRLQIIDLEGTGVSVAAILKYQEEKRPNWDKLMYKKTDYTTGIVYAIKAQGEEMMVHYDSRLIM